MAWILLIIAGVLEVVWAYAMKLSNGFTLTRRKAFGFNREIQGQVPRFLQKSALQK